MGTLQKNITKKSIHGLISGIFQQSDRASAIVAGCVVEELLEMLLNSFLISDSKTRKNLFQGMAPLSTFSAKIHIAYYLGLINENQYHDLKIIKKVRNRFAHSVNRLTFEELDIKDRCNQLKSVSKKAGESPKDHFKVVSTIISLLLFTKSEGIVRIEPYKYKSITEK